jgi:DNA polymerase-3 subunit delta
MTESPPTVYLLYGDHEIAHADFIDLLRTKMGDDANAAMNIDRFPADNLDLNTISQVCQSIPFITRRRLVILEEPTRLMKSESLRVAFFTLLGNLPSTTALLLIEPVNFKSTRGRMPSKLTDLIQWLDEHLPNAYVKRHEIPHGQDFVRWIQQTTNEMEGSIEPQAAHLLAELVAEDPRLAHQELVKLLDFVDRTRPIDVSDVERLTPFHGQSDVFAMVDAIGGRDGSIALNKLQRLLEEEPPLYAFSMVVRQFRLLLLAKQALQDQLDPKEVLKIHPYVAGKIIAQARNFSLGDLKNIYHQLHKMDVDSKTGRDDLTVALERFVAHLSR